jgi:hypothetical protein
MQLGTTFSHPYLRDYFKLPVLPAFRELLDLKLDYLRLGCYWQESEKAPGSFDFNELEALLELASRAKQKVILTLGMKAPRWPEFWVPSWVKEEVAIANPEMALKFIDTAVHHLGHYPAVSYWQVENEPLDPSGPHKLALPISLLEKEVALVRSASPKPLLLTLWGNRTLGDSRLTKLMSLGDVVGIDLYYQIPDGHGGFWGPSDSLESLKATINRSTKPIWITELQTNPWKKSPNLDHLAIIRENWQRATTLGVPLTLLWGFEYWYALLKKGDRTVWEFIRNRVHG